MSYEIKVWRDPYDVGYNVTKARKVELKPGLTVLVGCNGAGKSTFLLNVEEQARHEKIPILFYDNLTHGGKSEGFSAALWNGEMEFAATLWNSSEGEGISLNVGNKVASKLNMFLKTGKTKKGREMALAEAFERLSGENQKEESITNKRIILLDAVDSGFSIDNVLELKAFLSLVMEDSEKMGLETYILASANEYELVCGERCLDVISGKEISFKTYEAYKRFILKSRKKKELRLDKAEEKRKTGKQKEKNLHEDNVRKRRETWGNEGRG